MAIAANLANPDLLQSARFIVQVMEDARRRVVTAMQGGQGQHVTNLTCKLVHVSRWLTALATVYVRMAVVSATMALLETIARSCSRSKAAVIIVRVSVNVALLFWKLEASLVSGEILHLLLAFVLALTAPWATPAVGHPSSRPVLLHAQGKGCVEMGCASARLGSVDMIAVFHVLDSVLAAADVQTKACAIAMTDGLVSVASNAQAVPMLVRGMALALVECNQRQRSTIRCNLHQQRWQFGLNRRDLVERRTQRFGLSMSLDSPLWFAYATLVGRV